MRTKLFLGPTKGGWWVRSTAGESAATQQFFLQPIEAPASAKVIKTKREALAAARETAKKLVAAGGIVSLYIAGRNGRILEERTYPRSADPVKTRG